MLDRQLDVFGQEHDIAPQHERLRLFEPVRTTPGQTVLETDKRAANGQTSVGRCPVKGCRHRTFSETGRYAANCPDHGSYRLENVYGEYSDARCDARCTSAVGPLCSCSCGGHNHGIAHGA